MSVVFSGLWGLDFDGLNSTYHIVSPFWYKKYKNLLHFKWASGWSPFVCRIRYLKGKSLVFQSSSRSIRVLYSATKNKVRKTLVHVMSRKRLAELLPRPLSQGYKGCPSPTPVEHATKSAHFPGDLPHFLCYGSLRHNKFSWVEKRARQQALFF